MGGYCSKTPVFIGSFEGQTWCLSVFKTIGDSMESEVWHLMPVVFFVVVVWLLGKLL